MEKLRKEIEKVDKKIITLLAKRFILTKEIGVFKEKNNLPIYDEKREEELLESLEKEAKKLNIPPPLIKRLYKEIFEESRKIQERTLDKIVIISDVSCNDINGVSTALTYTEKYLKERHRKLLIIEPGMFHGMLLPHYKDLKLSLVTKRKMEKLLKEENPNYIHIATEGPLGLVARAVCIKNKWKFSTFYHTRVPEYIEIRFAKKLKKTTYNYMRWFHSKAENTMVSGSSLKEDLEKMNFKNVVLCPLGVDLEKFKKNKNAPLLPGVKKPIYTFVGRIAPEKNLRAFLKCDLPGTKLIIGDGNERKKLEKEFTDNVIFTGIKKGEDLVNLLSTSDVFVFPSKTETFGLVALEALACGVPVAAYTGAIGLKDIITNGVDGVFDDDLEAAIKKCLTLDRDNCRKKAAQFMWKKFVTTFVKNLVHI